MIVVSRYTVGFINHPRTVNGSPELVFPRNSITCHARWITLHGHRVELNPSLTQACGSIKSGFLAARRYQAILDG